MKLKNLLQFKKLTIPTTTSTSEIETVQLWSVRWFSRDGEYSHNVRQECEFFTSEVEAINFKIALQNAYKLIRHTSGTEVTLNQEN